jgi:hypothetical protein
MIAWLTKLRSKKTYPSIVKYRLSRSLKSIKLTLSNYVNQSVKLNCHLKAVLRANNPPLWKHKLDLARSSPKISLLICIHHLTALDICPSIAACNAHVCRTVFNTNTMIDKDNARNTCKSLPLLGKIHVPSKTAFFNRTRDSRIKLRSLKYVSLSLWKTTNRKHIFD